MKTSYGMYYIWICSSISHLYNDVFMSWYKALGSDLGFGMYLQVESCMMRFIDLSSSWKIDSCDCGAVEYDTCDKLSNHTCSISIGPLFIDLWSFEYHIMAKVAKIQQFLKLFSRLKSRKFWANIWKCVIWYGNIELNDTLVSIIIQI